MRVAEKFISINGEGVRAGELAVFVRFQGCNLACHYCDTKWALAKDCPYEEMSPEQIYAYIKSTGIKNVTLTGGEPLLHKDMDRLLAILLADEDLRVEIETNGAVDLRKFCACPGRPVFTMDYKLPPVPGVRSLPWTTNCLPADMKNPWYCPILNCCRRMIRSSSFPAVQRIWKKRIRLYRNMTCCVNAMSISVLFSATSNL